MGTTGTLQFYRARAEQARVEGEAATLEHVRERCRRSEEAWTALADRVARSEQLRAKGEQFKADQLAAQAGAEADFPLQPPPLPSN